MIDDAKHSYDLANAKIFDLGNSSVEVSPREEIFGQTKNLVDGRS